MRRFGFLFLILIVVSLSACVGENEPSGAYSGTLVLEGRHVYESGLVLPGALVVVDGAVELQPGSRVAGSVFLLGGRLTIGGQVDEDVSAIGGQLVVSPTARLATNLRVSNAELTLSPDATVEGQVLRGAASGVTPEELLPQRSLLTEAIWALPEALILAGLAYLALRVLPGPVDRISHAAIGHPVVSLAMGILVGLVGLVFLIVIAFTLILIPVTLLGLIIGFLAIGYGWIGIGLPVGRWLDRRWNLGLKPRMRAFWGTLLFMVAMNLIALIPYVGDTIYLLMAMLSLGAVLLTRFGLREFVPEMP